MDELEALRPQRLRVRERSCIFVLVEEVVTRCCTFRLDRGGFVHVLRFGEHKIQTQIFTDQEAARLWLDEHLA